MTRPEPRDTDFLRLEDLLIIAEGILGPIGVRELGLLESAAQRPRSSAFGQLAYPTLPLQAAALMHSLARFHPLLDGNKRLAWSAMRTFLMLNGHDLRYTVDDAEAFVLSVARGESDVAEIADWINGHLHEIDA